ncbi:MAG: hypothetical protein J0H82_29735 [Alphaproteobacteria bacterium]|jgi:hypothetical protein|nr:hypothetical protein [Alphaproteobacteria bacterium]
MSTALLRAAIERAAQKRGGGDLRQAEPTLSMREAVAAATAPRQAAPRRAATAPQPQQPQPAPAPPAPPPPIVLVSEQQAAGPGRPIGAAQFARSILDAERRECARAMRETVTGVDAGEFASLVQVIAKLKARYAAMVLELGRSERVGSNSIVATIKTLREQIEELEKGLGFLRQAVADGEIRVAGVQPPAH